jgi:hypothetical protein
MGTRVEDLEAVNVLTLPATRTSPSGRSDLVIALPRDLRQRVIAGT